MIRKDNNGRAKDKGIQPVPINDKSTVAWSSHDSERGFVRESNAPDPEVVAQINETIHKLNTNNLPSSSLNVWREAQASTYERNYPQQVLESLQKAATNRNFLSMDIESLGTMNPVAGKDAMTFYSPTEIAIAHMQVNAKKGARVVPGRMLNRKYGNSNALSMVLKPGKNYNALDQLVRRLENAHGLNIPLADDERRTLQDLILYSDPASFRSTKIHGIKATMIDRQARAEQLVGHASLIRKSTVAKIRAGLTNLQTLGTHPRNAAMLLDQFIGDVQGYGGDMSIIGHNFGAFDRPMMLDWLESQLGKGAHSKPQHALDRIKGLNFVDTLQVEKTLRRNPGILSGNLTLSNLVQVKGLANGTAEDHFGAYDIQSAGRLYAHQVVDFNRLQYHIPNPLGVVMKDARWSKFNTTPLQVGDKLFSISGVAGRNVGKYDTVLNHTGQGFEPAYMMKGAPSIYRNATYSLHSMMENVEIGGKNHFAVMLHNQDRNTYHFLARESAEEIQNIFHKNFSFVNPGRRDMLSRNFLAGESKRDAALRRWNKIFSTESGGGINLFNRMNSALEAYNAYGKGSSQEDIHRIVRHFGGYQDYQTKKWIPASDSFVRDFGVLKGRLRDESPYISQMISAIQSTHQLGGDAHAQNIALRHYKLLMDEHFGTNDYKAKANTTFRSVLGLNIDGEAHHLNVSSDIDAVQRSLSSIISSGHIRQNMTPSSIRTRLKQVVGQLRSQDIITPNQAKEIHSMIKGISSDQSGWYVMQEIGFRIDQARQRANEKGQVFGLRTIDIENPTKLMNARKGMLQDSMNGWHAKGKTMVIDRAIEDALAFKNRAYNGLVVHPDSVLENILHHHQEVVDRIIDKAGIDTTKIIGARNVKDALNDMLKSYIKNDMRATLYHSGDNRGLVMALYHQQHEGQIVGSRLPSLYKNNNVSLINIPIINSNMELVGGGVVKRIARPIAMKHGNSIRIGTAFDQVMNKLTTLAPTIQRMMNEGRSMLDIEGFAKGIVRRTSENLSINNSKTTNFDGNAFEVRKSMSSNWARRHTIDVNAFAEEWFTQTYGARHAGNVKNIMDDNRGMDFFEAMGSYQDIKNQYDGRLNTSMKFQEQIDPWLAKEYNLHVNSHSVKNTLVAQNVKSFANISELYPFGHYNPMARENMMKSVNYMPLDADLVRKNLAGNFNSADIDRMTKRGIITTTAHAELAGETNFLSLRTAYMDSAEVYDKFQNAHLSTHEGMFIMRSDVAQAFNAYKAKEIKLSEHSKLTNSIENRLMQALRAQHGVTDEAFDYSKSFLLDQRIKLPGARKNGKITIGVLSTDGIKNGMGIDHYEDPQNNVFIRGWDADNRKLILEKYERLQNGDKMLTTEGGRLTVSLASKEDFDAAGLSHVEAIAPKADLKKRMFGTYMDSSAQLAYDQMRRKVTVGDIALEEGLATLQGLMHRHFGTESKLNIVKDQLILDSLLGIDTKKTYTFSGVNSFLEEAQQAFGGHLVGGPHQVGQVGFALADISNWEDQMGVSDYGKEGKVRWGLKEVDVIQSRLNRLHSAGIATHNTSKWLTQHMAQTIAAQSPDAGRMATALTRTILTGMGDGEVRPGDVIIRTHATKGEFGLDNQDGKRYGIINQNNVVQVHANSFNHMPTKSIRGGHATIGDMQNTIITMGGSDLSLQGGLDGSPKNLGEALERNHGTALLELPEGHGMGKYVRLITQDVATIGGDMPVLKELQQKQTKIWRLLNQYNQAPEGTNTGSVIKDLSDAVHDYKAHATHIFSSAREQSLAKTLMTAKMDMSGRFKIQGINPVAAATRGYEEATAYVSRSSMRTMIKGSEHEITGVLFNEEERKAFAGMHVGKLREKILDKITQDGLYGFIGRYPSISEDTIQLMKMKIDPRLSKTYQGAMLTVGTAVKLKADHDGDVLAAVLAHYKLNNPEELRAMHKELGHIWTSDRDNISKFYHDELLPKINKDLAEGVTTQKLMRDPNFMNELVGNMALQTGGLHDLESTQARLGGQLIGYVDNTRQKLLNLSSSTYDILGRAGKYTSKELQDKRYLIEDFGRQLSQNYISSKKFNVEEIKASLAKDLGRTAVDSEVEAVVQKRRDALGTFMEGLLHPTNEGLGLMRKANDELGIFDDKDQFEKQIRETQNIFQLQGGKYNKGYLSNPSLKMGLSEGQSEKTVNELITGKGSYTVNTPWVKSFLHSLGDEGDEGLVKSNMLRTIKAHENIVLANFDRSNGSLNSFFGSSASRQLGDEMLGETAATDAGNKWRGLTDQLGSVFSHKSGGSFGPMKMAAAMFGGIWAGSMMSSEAPTPEDMRKNITQYDNPTNAPAAPNVMPGPTARVAMNGQNTQVHISGKGDLSQDQIAALLHSEMSNMSPTQLNLNMNVRDNTQNIDKQWLQQTMANSLNFGHAFG